MGGRPLGDNAWHLVAGGWHGRSLFVKVDDGIDKYTRNESVVLHPRMMPVFHTDSLGSVVVGGLPGSSSVERQVVQHDLHHGESRVSRRFLVCTADLKCGPCNVCSM